mmetsp:Transcript_17350/g.14077  ORF Transcript_17350/g.14077 Transcript_17350/m.14077 type:complete len:86 (-) Transcript_17350:2-259(-)
MAIPPFATKGHTGFFFFFFFFHTAQKESPRFRLSTVDPLLTPCSRGTYACRVPARTYGRKSARTARWSCAAYPGPCRSGALPAET